MHIPHGVCFVFLCGIKTLFSMLMGSKFARLYPIPIFSIVVIRQQPSQR